MCSLSYSSVQSLSLTIWKRYSSRPEPHHTWSLRWRCWVTWTSASPPRPRRALVRSDPATLTTLPAWSSWKGIEGNAMDTCTSLTYKSTSFLFWLLHSWMMSSCSRISVRVTPSLSRSVSTWDVTPVWYFQNISVSLIMRELVMAELLRSQILMIQSVTVSAIMLTNSSPGLDRAVTVYNYCQYRCHEIKWSPLGKPSKKKCNIFYIRVWPPPLFCVKCNEKWIYFLSIIRAYLGHIEPIKIFYPQNHLKKYEKSAKI